MITSPTLTQAQQTLGVVLQQRVVLQRQVSDQSIKIAEMEQEIQRLSSLLSQTQQQLITSREEASALRSQLPDEATVRAFNDLTEYLCHLTQAQPEMRMAA